ncbi:transcriptional regulator [Paenibacillus baekrokdamisoli]|uniref:Transcriptional regulator n=1 Tax=Paenibacillus baekrokdamisoli TaxID=1712516 RepID=A0A3G9JE95_9BACL|nr:helix-turn-helix transcriptional regulator [Paenibacillus baekrokdamisoli]MBB3072620.1 transcriptional regulator with XRE-family HTH domain [Paenibacillus baekrokdamisoli]BBH22328.1 transcriptional regulator [Paenibacillus baekrokdamisoli]
MFGNRLTELRNKKGLSQYGLADCLSFSRTQIANYEQGKREPDFATLIKLADFFDVSLDFLIGRSDHLVDADYELQNVIYTNTHRIDLTADESEYLKESLEIFRRSKAKWLEIDRK